MPNGRWEITTDPDLNLMKKIYRDQLTQCMIIIKYIASMEDCKELQHSDVRKGVELQCAQDLIYKILLVIVLSLISISI